MTRTQRVHLWVRTPSGGPRPSRQVFLFALLLPLALAQPSIPQVAQQFPTTLEQLDRHAPDLLRRLAGFCPDLAGEIEAAAMVSSVYVLLESVGRGEEVVGLAQRLLDIAGTTATMATAEAVPKSDCANLYGVYYLFRFEDDLRPDEAYAATMELIATGIGFLWE